MTVTRHGSNEPTQGAYKATNKHNEANFICYWSLIRNSATDLFLSAFDCNDTSLWLNFIFWTENYLLGLFRLSCIILILSYRMYQNWTQTNFPLFNQLLCKKSDLFWFIGDTLTGSAPLSILWTNQKEGGNVEMSPYFYIAVISVARCHKKWKPSCSVLLK